MQAGPGHMPTPPTLLAGRIFRIAAVGVATLVIGAIAFVVADEQCDANGGAHCTRTPPASPLTEPSAASENFHDVSEVVKETDSIDAAVDALAHADSVDAVVDGKASADSVDAIIDGKAKKVVTTPELGIMRLGLVLGMLLFILAWLLMMVKFACDGSLPARLAQWGLLPEAYAAISVRAVYHLLRLKENPTPVIVLRNCITNENAPLLAMAMDQFGDHADLQALEFPHNPQLNATGLRHIMESVLRPTSKVVELDFSYNPQFGDSAVPALRPALEEKASKITVLKLSDCGFSHAGLSQLAQASTKSKLRTLDLSWHCLKDSGDLVASITENAPMLEELILNCCELEADDVATLAEQLPYTSIKTLQLGGNRFGSLGLEKLCEHLPTSQVDELGLEGVGLEAGCDGLGALAAAWVKRPFSRLLLRGNRMTDDDIRAYVNTLKSMQA